MASVSRTAQFTKLHRLLKKHYRPVAPDSKRPVLEHLLFACCLEDVHHQAAEEAYAALEHTFFDWNEVRVTSVTELSEVMRGLPDPRAAANRVKRVLQSVFEGTYAFDLEDRRKENLGPTIKWFRKIDGTTSFSVAYVVQSALGGHAIPVDTGTLRVLRIVGLISDQDVEAGEVPGLERAIVKTKGVEFGSMLHQLGADFAANPYSSTLRKILLEVNPDIADQLPKRRSAKRTDRKAAGASAGATKTKTAPAGQRKKTSKKKVAGKGKKSSAKQAKSVSAAKKKSARPSKKKKTTKRASSGAAKTRRKSASEGLSKRKPR
jgi:endonuclease-3